MGRFTEWLADLVYDIRSSFRPKFDIEKFNNQIIEDNTRKLHAERERELTDLEPLLRSSNHQDQREQLIRFFKMPITTSTRLKYDATGSIDDLIDYIENARARREFTILHEYSDRFDILLNTGSFQADNGLHYIRDKVLNVWRTDERSFAWRVDEHEILD